MGSFVISIAGCLALFAALRHARAQTGGLGCPRGLSPPFAVYGNSCYNFVSTEKTWENARLHCRQQNAVGSKLVSVPDMATQNWIVGRITAMRWTNTGIWLGLHDRIRERRFLWDEYYGSDTPANFFNWNPGEPDFSRNQNCVYMRRQSGWRWADAECNWTPMRTYSFICQYRLTSVAIITSATAGVTTPLFSSTSAPTTLTLRTPTFKSTSPLLSTDRGLTAFTALQQSNRTVATPSQDSLAASTGATAQSLSDLWPTPAGPVRLRLTSTLTVATALPTAPALSPNGSVTVAWTTSVDLLTSSVASDVAVQSSTSSSISHSTDRSPSNAIEAVTGATRVSQSGSGYSAAEASKSSGITSSEMVTGASTAIIAGTSTAPSDELADFSSWLTSHSVYPGLLASSETTTSDDRLDFTVTSPSTARDKMATAASLATAAEKSTNRPTESSDYANPAANRTSTAISVTSTDLVSARAAAYSTSRSTTMLREIFTTDISATAASHTGSRIYSGTYDAQTADLGLQVGVGAGVPLLLVVVVVVVLLKHRKNLRCCLGQKFHLHQINIENPAYSAWDANERMTLSNRSDGPAEVQLEKVKFNRDKELNYPLLKHDELA